MTKTAVQMIMAAKAQVGAVSPEGVSAEPDPSTAVLLDVREAEEWQHGHLDGAFPAPRGLVEFFADPTSPTSRQALDPARRVIVVPSGRSVSLARRRRTLKDMGYEDVAVLEGGLKAWTDAGLPTCEHEYSGI